MPKGLPFAVMDYPELLGWSGLDWIGRIVRDDKRGSIAEDTPPSCNGWENIIVES